MPTPLLVTSLDPSSDYPLLLIDKEGEIGALLALSLRSVSLPLLLSKKKPREKGIVYIPYTSSFPKLPQNFFSHIVIVYQGEKELFRQMPVLVKKAQQSGAPLLVVTSMYHASEKLVRIVTQYPKARVLIFGDLFGSTSISSPAARLLLQAGRHKKIMLSHTGLSLLYPIALLDLTQLILEMLLTDSTQRIFFASDKPRTELSFVRLLQQAEPLIKVDFQSEKTKQKKRPSFIPQAAFPLQPHNSSLEKRLREAIILIENDSTPSSSRIKKRQRKNILEKMVAGAVFLLFLPLVVTIVCVSVGFAGVGIAGYGFEKGNIPLAKKAAEVSRFSFRLAEPSEQLLLSAFERTGIPLTKSLPFTLVASGKTSADLLWHVSQAVTLFEEGLSGQGEPSADQIRVSLKKAVFALQELRAQELLPASYREKIKQDERAISQLSALLESTPSLLGYEGKKTYALLFQDNLELRAGGGFIRSLALVSFEKGKMSPMHLQDVYDADAKLKGHLDPPFLLRRHLGAAHWYLRDSNMSLDSSENATQAAQFIFLETGEKVDGVLSLDASFLRSLLGASGSLYLPEFDTTVTEDNLFSQLLTHGQLSVVKESSEKDFFSVFVKALFAKLAREPISTVELGRIISRAIYQKHVLATSPDPTIQPLLSRSNLVSTPKVAQEGDFLGIIESNIGANKANYFLKRSMTHRVELKEDLSASSSVSLLYVNTGSSDTEGLEYKAYVQLALPAGSSLVSIVINGTPQQVVPGVTDPEIYTDTSFKEPKGMEVVEEVMFGKKIYGFVLSVKEKEERSITITYTSPRVATSASSRIQYPLYYFKQPGVEQDDYRLELSYPRSFTPIKAPFETEKEASGVSLEKVFKEDEVLRFEFATRR